MILMCTLPIVPFLRLMWNFHWELLQPIVEDDLWQMEKRERRNGGLTEGFGGRERGIKEAYE